MRLAGHELSKPVKIPVLVLVAGVDAGGTSAERGRAPPERLDLAVAVARLEAFPLVGLARAVAPF